MLTRRRILHLGATAGASVLTMQSGGALAEAPSTVKTPVDFEVPRGACDCHVHVFDPARFAYDAHRVYTPPEATAADLLGLQSALRFDRVVIVQPSVYGTDMAATLDGMKKLGAQRARGVAVIDADTPKAALDAMHAAGVRGVRLNLETVGESDPQAVKRALATTAEQLRGRGWHIQFNTNLAMVAAIRDELAALPMPVVLDHFARAKASLGPSQAGFDALLALVKAGRAYVKISAAYRISDQKPDFPDAAAIAQAIVAANPDRVVWGSNWPHPGRGKTRTDTAPPYPSDDGMLLNQLPKWVPDAATRRKILVENPARLYGFEGA
jgi:predicted TIM-barrel fold metal-dependent hydrolase